MDQMTEEIISIL